MPATTTTIIICPLCNARVQVTAHRYFFTIYRDTKNRPVEMRVMEEGRVAHSCPMSAV